MVSIGKGPFFSEPKNMNGVGLKLSGRTSVPKEPLGYPAPRVFKF